jgi:hypothetical protein
LNALTKLSTKLQNIYAVDLAMQEDELPLKAPFQPKWVFELLVKLFVLSKIGVIF